MPHVLMRSVSGIRGIVGEGLTPPVLAAYVHAFVQVVGRGRVLVGRDARDTGPLLEQITLATLALSGCTAVRLGIASTPTIEMAVQADQQAVGGIILTASHNPAPWNALKFLGPHGLFLGPHEVADLLRRVDSGLAEWPRHDGCGTVVDGPDGEELHLDAVLALPHVDGPKIAARRFRVAVDCVNGATWRIAPRLLERLGCEVVPLHVTPDGTFPRGAEPVPEALVDLGRAVLKHNCDLGLAFDPDGDRLALVDEEGRPLGEESTLALGVKHVLSITPGDVAINLSTSAMSEDLAEAANVRCLRTPVGEIHVARAMLDDRCVVGGEGNGGLILPALHPGRDGILAAAIVLDLLRSTERKLSEEAAALPRYSMIKTRFDLAGRDLGGAFGRLRATFADAVIDDRDGLRLSWPGKWLHLRASNTEPILRAIAEARTESEARFLCRAAEESI